MNNKLWMAACSCALAIIAGCSEPEQQEVAEVTQPVKVMTIGGASGELTREFPGTVRATQRVTMSFQVPGRLVEFPVREGQPVKEGDQLGRLDDSDYRSSLDAAQADLTRSEANFKRAQELIQQNYVSQADYDQIQANYNIAKSNAAKAQKAFDDTHLIAPFDGVVARTFVQNFQEVQAKEPVLSLQNTEELEVVVNVPESLVVRRGDEVDLTLTGTFQSIPGVTFPLKIKEFATEANPDTQTFDYVLSIEDAQGHNLLPGMTAVVRGERTSTAGSANFNIRIPLSALASTEDETASVWVLDESNRVSQHQIITGELTGSDTIEVRSGLAVGDRLAIAGVSTLREGMKVKPIDKVEF